MKCRHQPTMHYGWNPDGYWYEAPIKNRGPHWLMQCECGTRKVVRECHMTAPVPTVSCGCWNARSNRPPRRIGPYTHGHTARGYVRVVAMERPTFTEDAALLTSRSFKAEQYMIPEKLWDCLVDVIASHDRAKEKLKEMYASDMDLALSVAVPALQVFAHRAKVR